MLRGKSTLVGAIGKCVSGVEINSLLFVEMSKEFCIEACGLTRSPLDDWRGSGRIAKEKGLWAGGGNVIVHPEYAFDIAGNNVKIDWAYVEKVEKERQEELIKYIATIKEIIPKQSLYKMVETSAGEPLVEGIDYEVLKPIEKKRSVSPCPCKSKECMEDYKLWKE